MTARIERHSFRMVLLAMLSLSMPACYAHDPARSSAIAPIGVGDVVSRDELVASGALSLYDALVRTRQNFFASRGVTSLTNPASDALLVFRHGAIMGTVDVLSMIRPSDVRAVRRISTTETYHRYGRTVSVGGLELEFVDDR
jgi:hypothetical protein